MAADQNTKDHRETYSSFINLMKWGTVGCILVAAFVVLLISS